MASWRMGRFWGMNKPSIPSRKEKIVAAKSPKKSARTPKKATPSKRRPRKRRTSRAKPPSLTTAERLKERLPDLAQTAFLALLDRPLQDLVEPESWATALGSILESDILVPRLRELLQQPLEQEWELWRDSRRTVRALLSDETVELLENLVTSPAWTEGDWVREVAQNRVFEEITGTMLYEVLRDFSVTVNPFFSSWGLPALLKKSPLGRIGLFGANPLQAGGRLLETMREEFERQLEPHLKAFLQRCTGAALLRAVDLTLSDANQQAFADLRLDLLREFLDREVSGILREIEDLHELETAQSLADSVAQDILAELRTRDHAATVRAFLSEQGAQSLGRHLQEAGIDGKTWATAWAESSLPVLRAILANDAVSQLLEEAVAPDPGGASALGQWRVRAAMKANSGGRTAADVSGTQHEENKGFSDNSAPKEEHDPDSGPAGET